jgi:hypothetical protein
LAIIKGQKYSAVLRCCEKDKDGIDWREWCKKTDITGTRKKKEEKNR